MKIWYNGDATDLSYSACPAGHLPAAECPKEWFEDDGVTPRTFPVKFVNGGAIVPTSVGKYLIAQRVARGHKLRMPGAGF